MSLTNIVYTPVDTGTAKVSPNVENTKVKDFYLLAGEKGSFKYSRDRTCPVSNKKLIEFYIGPDQLTRFIIRFIVIFSIVALTINSVSLIFIISYFSVPSLSSVVIVFVL